MKRMIVLCSCHGTYMYLNVNDLLLLECTRVIQNDLLEVMSYHLVPHQINNHLHAPAAVLDVVRSQTLCH